MEVRHARCFLALAEERHFGRAAASLRIAQPSLSQQVQQLERLLGIRLFDRSTRRVELTEAGRRLLPHAAALVADVERAQADLALLAAGRSGRVSVGFVGTATYDVLPRVAREVQQELPDVDLQLRGEMLSPQLVQGLRQRAFDLALLRPDGDVTSGLRMRRLRRERLVAVLPSAHALASRKSISLAELADEPFVVHPSGHRSSMHERVLAACSAAGFRPPFREVAETATLVVFVAGGLGVALVPEPVRSLGLDGVAYVALRAAPNVELMLAARDEELPPAAARVAAVIARCAPPTFRR